MHKWLDDWEPYEGRLSRTVLRGAAGEVPVVYLLEAIVLRHPNEGKKTEGRAELSKKAVNECYWTRK